MITLDTPLFIRLLEYAREEAASDVDLHYVAENAEKICSEAGGDACCLTMEYYEQLVPAKPSGPTEALLSSIRGCLTEQGAPSPEDFLKLLKSHDWYYDMSDDHRVWDSGRRESEKIHGLLKQFPNELRSVYDEFIKAKFPTKR